MKSSRTRADRFRRRHAALWAVLLLGCEGSPPAQPKSSAAGAEASAARAPAPPPLPAPAPASTPEPLTEPEALAYPGLAPTPDAPVTHTVRPGEDPFSIAARYDEAPRWLRKWNRLEVGARLRPGHKVHVRARRNPPPLESIAYTTRAGDTVESIGRAHGIYVRSLARLLHRKREAPFEAGVELELWVDPTLRAWLDSPANQKLGEAGLAGGFGVGAPDDGYLANAVRIPEHPDWQLRFPNQAYGDSWAVEGAVEALHAFRRISGYAGPLRVWSMSRHYGGEIEAHHSHRTGRDLDVKLPLRADLPATLAVKPDWVDYEALWHLIAAFVDTGRVKDIYLDHDIATRVEQTAAAMGVAEARRRELISAPRPLLSKAGVVKHQDGHQDHIHVRFSCPPWGIYCTDR